MNDRMLVLQVAEARDVEPAGPAVIERARLADEILHQPDHARAHQVLAEIVADVAARVADAVRVRAAISTAAEPRRLERRGREDHDLPLRLVRSSRLRVDERDAARLAGVRIDEHLARRRVRPQREMPGVQRRVDQTGGRVERGVDVAAARAAVARAAAEAPAPILVVLQAIRRHAGAVRREHAVHPCQRARAAGLPPRSAWSAAGRGCRAGAADSLSDAEMPR